MVVEGRLVMRPASAEVDHLLVFQGVDEGRMVGGGMDVVKADVGLWVMGAGTLDLAGTARRAWTRLTGAVAAGTTRLALQDAPTGWRPGDELLVAPTLAPDQPDNWKAYSAAKVRSVSGRNVTLDRPTSFAHPAVDVVTDAGSGRVQTAEVLNLTRNVRIEGTPGHRSHVFVRSSSPQKVKGVAIRHMGPRKKAEEFTELVLGRYGLHLHMCGDGSRGSEVEGVVIRDTGSHTFVPHLSNGIAFRDCISHNTFEDAFWWDGAPDTRTPGSPSHDILYERCVASLVQYDPPFRGFTLTGFSLGRGQRQRHPRQRGRRHPGRHQRRRLPVARGRRGHLEVRAQHRPQQRQPRHLHLAEHREAARHHQLHRLPQRRRRHLPRRLQQPLHLPRLDPVREPGRGPDHPRRLLGRARTRPSSS